jgi:hypothetical protein
VYDRSADRLPPWALHITPKGVADTVRIIKDLNLRVIMDLNTVSTTPHVMAGWVAEVLRDAGLPPGSLANLEIGNEPDIYNRQTWEYNIKASNRPSSLTKAAVTPHNAPDRVTKESYVQRYLEYARELAHAAPGVALAAPALAESSENLTWISTLLRQPHRLGIVTAHVYPYSKCAKPGEPKYPTVQKLLSENATAGMRRTVTPVVALAHRAGFSVRLTEFNSVTCGGLAGVSDTFATALWAPDALFELLRSGVEGVNLHARVQSVNDPFDFTPSGLHTHPLLYGLILFTRMLGAHDELVPVQLHGSRSLHLKVWAVRAGEATNKLNTLKVLLINKGPRSALIDLHLPTSSPATVVRLEAPSASSGETEVTLGGQRLNQQAQWSGKPQVETINPTAGGYLVRVKGESAAQLTVPIAATTLAPPKEAPRGPKPQFGYG